MGNGETQYVYVLQNAKPGCKTHYYMTDSRDRGISQSAFQNPSRYIPIRTGISSQQNYYEPNVFY